jgi:hypothetical protein
MSLSTPLRLDRIQKALFETLADACAPTLVAWGYSELAWETVPDEGLISLTMVGGPSPFIRSGKRGALLNAADSILLTVASVGLGRYLIHLNDFSYYTDGVGGDTLTTIRDRLVDLINADALETATASPSGGDSLLLTADELGGLRSLTISGPLTAGAPVLDGRSVLLTEGAQNMLVNVQAYAKGREPRDGAWSLIQRALATVQSEDYVSTMRHFGVGVWTKGVVSDLSAIAGAHWETRVSFDLSIAAKAVWVRPVDRVESVNATLNTAGPATQTVFTVNAP